MNQMMDWTDGTVWVLEYFKTLLLVLGIVAVMILLSAVVLLAYKSLAEKYLPKPEEKISPVIARSPKGDVAIPSKDDDNSHFNFQHFE